MFLMIFPTKRNTLLYIWIFFINITMLYNEQHTMLGKDINAMTRANDYMEKQSWGISITLSRLWSVSD